MEVNLEVHKSIIEKSKRGHSGAQLDLYKLYSKAMFNTCYRMMNQLEDAEDMLQESFSSAFQMLHTFNYRSTFGAWLKRIVLNKCINEIKRRKLDLVYVESIPIEVPKNEETIGLSIEQIKKAMQQLPNGSRIIFSLYLLEGHTHKEIASILDMSESNSKSQYMRAKNKVKEILKKEVGHEL